MLHALRSSRFAHASLLVVVVALLAGCDSNEPESASSFHAEIAAEASVVEVDGDVVLGYAREPDTDALGFSISMNNQETGMIELFTPRSRPEAGTYALQNYVNLSGGTISTSSFVGHAVIWVGAVNYRSTSGTVTITTSSPERVSGHFEFLAARLGKAPVESVTVEGSFDARLSEPLPDLPAELWAEGATLGRGSSADRLR